MKYIKFIITTFILFISSISIVYAVDRPKSVSEAYDYVSKKENGYCVYKTDNLVLGIQTNGTTSIVGSYLYYINSEPTKTLFAIRGYEKDVCPAYAMVASGYLNDDSTYTFAIFLADSQSTLNNIFKDSDEYKSGSSSFKRDKSTLKVMSLERNVGIMTPNEDGTTDGSTYVDDTTGEKASAYNSVKQEYLNKYNCVYADDSNKIVFGYSKGKTGELYLKGIRTSYYKPPTGSYTSGEAGEIAGNCANYAMAAKGTYEDKDAYAVLLADETKDLTSKKFGLSSINISSSIMNNLKASGNVGGEDLGEVQPDITYEGMDCYGLLGMPKDPNSPAYWLQLALKIMRYAAIGALLILSTIDFVMAITKQDNDALKKAIQTTIKRFIFAVLLFFVPLLTEFIMDFFGVYGTCAL